MKKYIVTALLASFLLAGCGQIEPYTGAELGTSERPTMKPVSESVSEDQPETEEQTEAPTTDAPEIENGSEAPTSTKKSTDSETMLIERTTSASREDKVEPQTTAPEITQAQTSTVTSTVPKKPDNSGEIIYSRYASYLDMTYTEELPPEGGYRLGSELSQAIADHPDSRFAVRIDVYSPDRNEVKDDFLRSCSIGGMTYPELCAEADALRTEYSDLLTEMKLNENSVDNTARMNAVSKRLTELDAIRNDMIYAAEQNYLTAESQRLASHGINTVGISHNSGYTNYVLAIVTADEIRSMPFDSSIGYKIYLDCK